MSLTFEERLDRIERALGFVDAPLDVEAFLKSPQAMEDFKAAVWKFKCKDKKPLENFLKKTGGKAPKEKTT